MLTVARDQFSGTVRGLEVVREGDTSTGFRGLANRSQLLAAFGDQLVLVRRRA